MRKGSPTAALARFTDLEQRFPEYGAKDKLLFYSARVLEKLGRREEAERYYGRVIAEFPDSEFAGKARSARAGRRRSPANTATANPRPRRPAQTDPGGYAGFAQARSLTVRGPRRTFKAEIVRLRIS